MSANANARAPLWKARHARLRCVVCASCIEEGTKLSTNVECRAETDLDDDLLVCMTSPNARNRSPASIVDRLDWHDAPLPSMGSRQFNCTRIATSDTTSSSMPWMVRQEPADVPVRREPGGCSGGSPDPLPPVSEEDRQGRQWRSECGKWLLHSLSRAQAPDRHLDSLIASNRREAAASHDADNDETLCPGHRQQRAVKYRLNVGPHLDPTHLTCEGERAGQSGGHHARIGMVPMVQLVHHATRAARRPTPSGPHIALSQPSRAALAPTLLATRC